MEGGVVLARTSSVLLKIEAIELLNDPALQQSGVLLANVALFTPPLQY